MMRAVGFDGAALKVGDIVADLGQKAGIFVPGAARWYALRVEPQHEDQAETWLGLRGVDAFHPVLMRKTVRFGKVREYARRYLPGYVFARFQGEPITSRVLSSPFITGAVCRSDGHWGVLETKGLAAIHSMRKLDAAQRDARAAAIARRRASARVRAGGSAMFHDGPFSGLPCEVVELRADGGAIVRVNIFGRDTMVTAETGELVAMQKAG